MCLGKNVLISGAVQTCKGWLLGGKLRTLPRKVQAERECQTGGRRNVTRLGEQGELMELVELKAVPPCLIPCWVTHR